MTSEVAHAAACVHACQEGCGRPYDIMVVLVVDGSTLMHCIPCHQAFIVNMTRAMIEADDPQVQEVVANADLTGVMIVDPDAPGFRFASVPAVPTEDEFSFDGMVEE